MSNKQALALVKSDVVDVVATRVRSLIGNGQLHLPPNYSAENALKSAWLKLQSVETRDKRPALEACTKDSIANSLLDMIVQGLNPAKDQCYFIAYGNQLSCQRSYFGDMHLVKLIEPGAEIYAEIIWQGDQVEYEIQRGNKIITRHVQKLENVGNLDKIAGTYCVIEIPGQPPRTTIMTIDQIKESWKKSKTYGKVKDTPHTEQPDQMALRTVVRRACKPIINSSNDEYLLRSVVRSELESVDAEIEEEAALEEHQQVIDIEPPEPEEEAEEEQEQEPVAAGRTAPF